MSDPTRDNTHRQDLDNAKLDWRFWSTSPNKDDDIARERSATRAAFFAGYRYALSRERKAR